MQNLKPAFAVVLMLCLFGIGMTLIQQSDSKSSSSSSSSSSSDSSMETNTYKSLCSRKRFRRFHKCEQCCVKDCHSCQQNNRGKWKCKKVFCDPLEDPMNGAVTDDRRCGSSALYSCNSGYQLSGSDTRYCLKSGKWSDEAPTCLAICPDLCPPSNGHITVESNLQGSMANYSCEEDYELIGPDVRTCLPDRTWDGYDPICIKNVRCPELCNPDNGYTLYHDTIVGSVATFGCSPDYELSDNENRTCEGSGNWSSPSPVCTPVVRCPELCNPDNGYTLYTLTTVGSEATFGCSPDYELSDNENRTCEGSGNWSSPSPVCNQVVRCPALCPLEHGQVTMTGTAVGDTAYYSCEPGYQLEGSDIRTCQNTSDWTGNHPICIEEVMCPMLCPPKFGTIYISDRSVGSTLEYSCDRVYKLVGPNNRTCKADGTWDKNEPVCILAADDCGQPWYEVYRNNFVGNKISGNKDVLLDAVLKGALVKVASLENDITFIYPIQTAYIIGDNVTGEDVCGQAVYDVTRSEIKTLNNPSARLMVNFCTTGLYTYVLYLTGTHLSIGRRLVGSTLQWFIRHRCNSEPILSLSQTGSVMSGSIGAVIDAVKHGDDCRISEDDKVLYTADNLHYDDAETSVVAMTISRIRAEEDTYFGFKYLAFSPDVNSNSRQFIVQSTSGARQVSEWEIGDHVMHGVQTNGVKTDWYRDSCWDKVLGNDEWGNETYGSKSNLIAKAYNGHRLKVVFNMFSVEATEILIRSDHLCAFIYNSLTKSTIDTLSTDLHWEWMILCTNGTKNTARYEYGSNYLNDTMSENVSMMWFVDRRKYQSIYATNSTNSVSKGNINALLQEARSGADVRLKVSNDSDLKSIISAENIWIDNEIDGLQAIFTRLISLSIDSDGEIMISPNAYHIYTLIKTDGSVEYAMWTVGEHEYRGGEIHHDFSVEWFVSS